MATGGERKKVEGKDERYIFSPLTDKPEIWSILVNQKEHIHFYIRKNSHYFSLSHENQF